MGSWPGMSPPAEVIQTIHHCEQMVFQTFFTSIWDRKYNLLLWKDKVIEF
jgi:hypothetical protein